jgi:hypothetical protein
MSSENGGPSLERTLVEDSSTSLSAPAPAPAPAPPAAASSASPATLGPGTASADDLGLSLTQLNPDPFLEEFSPQASASDAKPRAAAASNVAKLLAALDIDVPPSAEVPIVATPPSGVSAVVAALNLAPQPAPVELGMVDLYAPPPSGDEAVPAPAGKAAGRARGAERDDEDEDEDRPARGRSLLIAGLASYASAVTLGLIWVLWSHRAAREVVGVEADPFPAVRATSDPGHRAGESGKSVPPEPLPANRIVSLGETIDVGSLRVMPLDVSLGPVILVREFHPSEKRLGGEDALRLRIRLENRSSDWHLVPLDEAFIRERGRGIRDSFIVAGSSRHLEMFPLAVVSEWSIRGQEFRLLGPGESYETLVVSAPGVADRLAREMTWRLRLRVDVNQTETLGVRFTREEIRMPAIRHDEELELQDLREPPDGPIRGR